MEVTTTGNLSASGIFGFYDEKQNPTYGSDTTAFNLSAPLALGFPVKFAGDKYTLQPGLKLEPIYYYGAGWRNQHLTLLKSLPEGLYSHTAGLYEGKEGVIDLTGAGTADMDFGSFGTFSLELGRVNLADSSSSGPGMSLPQNAIDPLPAAGAVIGQGGTLNGDTNVVGGFGPTFAVGYASTSEGVTGTAKLGLKYENRRVRLEAATHSSQTGGPFLDTLKGFEDLKKGPKGGATITVKGADVSGTIFVNTTFSSSDGEWTDQGTVIGTTKKEKSLTYGGAGLSFGIGKGQSIELRFAVGRHRTSERTASLDGRFYQDVDRTSATMYEGGLSYLQGPFRLTAGYLDVGVTNEAQVQDARNESNSVGFLAAAFDFEMFKTGAKK